MFHIVSTSTGIRAADIRNLRITRITSIVTAVLFKGPIICTKSLTKDKPHG